MEKIAIVIDTIGPLKQEIGFHMEAADETLFGRLVTILREEKDNWYYVETDYRYTGYIHGDYLLIDREKADEWDRDANHIVKWGIIDVMKEPKYQSYSIKLLTRGAIIQLTGNINKNWVEIIMPTGERGWVKKELIGNRIRPGKVEKELRQKVVDTALAYLGTQYRWGGKTPLGIDCSGLTSISYLINGVVIYRDSQIKEEFGMRRISKEEMKPGDLLYWPGHVAIYIGNDKYIHSTGASGGVVINSLNPDHADYRGYLVKIKEIGTVF
ncbi:SH3 domain-containing C40 family peptidase [Schnuerera ultunensis]|nr:SH3 domain-containing C40 family peptidase [Schnuerera ultunensis]